MKSKNIIICLGLFLLIGLVACSDREGSDEQIKTGGEGLPIFATLDTRALPSNLGCELFVFWKSTSETDYIFKESIDLTGETLPYEMQFGDDDAQNKQYRFLFVAQPIDGKKMVVSNNGSAFQVGDNWLNTQIETTEQYLTEDYYYDILDKTGTEIIASGNINGDLTRLVGQMTLDIFRMEEMDNEMNPVNIKSTAIASVLDRVHTINVEYHKLTKSISFDIAGNIIEKENWDAPYTQTIKPTLGDTLQVNLPQVSLGLIAGEQNGSVRIKGVCGFTSSPKIRAKYTFTYYDTTPINEIFHHVHIQRCYLICDTIGSGHIHNDDCYSTKPVNCKYPAHVHDADCFDDTKKLVLNLPQETGYTKLLNIIPNTYTVNKAGIRMDRIIDLDQPSSFGFDVAWENEKN